MFPALLSRFFARRALAFLAVAAAMVVFARAQSPSAVDGFDPNVDGNVYAVVAQPDGKLLLGGQFTSVGGFPRNNLARLNADGSLDQAFNPNPDGPVRAIVLLGDNRIVVGGDFTKLQPGGSGATVTRSQLARLNLDGSVDAGFNYTIGGSNAAIGGDLRPQVFALVVQPDGALVVGGAFTTVQPGNLTVIFTRQNLFRIAANGAIDAGFDPAPNGMVLALANHVASKLVVGGGFTTINGATRNRIARLNPSGTVDSEFNPNANNGVTAIAVQRDGKILLGGYFTTLQPPTDDSAANRTHLGRLNPDGTLDSEFYPRAEGNVSAIAVQPDGSFLIGGTFTGVWGRGANSVARSYVARFNPDASLDTSFAPAVNGEVNAFAFQADGRIIIGGHFTRAQPAGRATALVRNHVARLNTDGSFDATFELDAGGRILASVTQSDGKLVIAGTFTNVGGAPHNYVARLNADGTVDPTYNPDFNGRVYTLAYDAASNKVLAGGAFTTIGGETRNHIARLNASGTIDSEFNPNIDGQVGVILLQPDGKILVGGTFSSVSPIGANGAASTRGNMLRLNSSGTLDTAFHPNPNSSVAAIALQGDGKILIGGLFNTLTDDVDLTPVTTTTNGTTSTTIPTGTTTARAYLARLGTDGLLDKDFKPTLNSQVSAIAVQSDGKIVIGGAFTTVVGSDGVLATITNTNGTTSQVAPTRNHIARLLADGKLDTGYDPNPNNNVVAIALQSDGKAIIGGPFTTVQPNGRTDWFLRKYIARINTDGTLDETFNLDVSELPGNRVDSIRIASDGRLYVGGAFTSLQPAGTPARIARRNFVRLNANLTVDTAFDPGTGGATGAIVNGLAVQPDGKIIAVGSFADLGGAKSTNIARFQPEGTADPEFSSSLSTDGPVNAVAVRPDAAPVASQLSGFAWLLANGTKRAAFAAAARLSGEIRAIATQADGSLLLGGAFTNVDNTTAGNLVRFSPTGVLDPSFSPAPNGSVTGIVVQSDGRIIITGSFTAVGSATRNRIARLDPSGSVDVTYDPNANGKIDAILLQPDGLVVVGGAFTSFTPNLATTAVTRNYLARIKADGTVDDGYNPAPNSTIGALALQPDNKIIAGGTFTSVQPNGGTTSFTRNNLARFNPDGTLDQNFDPNANAAVSALTVLANGQILVGGAFSTLQPGATGAVSARNNLARINSDGAVDATFNPSPNAAVTSIAVQPDGQILIGGAFTTVQPGATGTSTSRNHFARLTSAGAVDASFNPDVAGTVSTIVARADGTILVGGRFDTLELNGAIMVGGNFQNIGGLAAQNLAMLNENGSVNATFQPRPNGAINALLVQPDGKIVVGGAFTTIAGATRNRLARFNADGSLDATFNPSSASVVTALALQAEGRILVGGRGSGGLAAGSLVRLNADGSADATFVAATTGLGIARLAVQSDGKILVVIEGSGVRHTLARMNADGSADGSFTDIPNPSGTFDALAVQADGRVLVSGDFTLSGVARLARLNPAGGVDTTFNPAPSGRVTALAIQSDGRVVIGGGFNTVGGQSRVGLARLAAAGSAAQALGVAANRTSVTWTRSGTIGEIAAAIFESSSDRITWRPLGRGVRLAGGANWQLAGLNLPATGVFYIRARGIVSSGTSSGLYESVREFTFSSPLPATIIPIAVTPQTSGAPVFDTATGIAPRAAISVVPGEGSVEIFVSSAVQLPANPQPARLANLSTRGRVAADSPLILGFAIAGNDARRVLVRAVGPALNGFGVGGALPATRLQVYDAAGTVLATNQGWTGADVAQAAATTGAFPLTAGSADSAALLTLAPGNYTLQVVDPRGSGGVALAEIYDAGTGAGSRLVNVSSRAATGTGANALISGFVIAGDAPARVLLRGVGPSLAQFGATGVVADPSVALYDADGRELGSNDNWVSSVTTISSATTAAGAFPLTAGSKDAAVLANLPAGAYTIQVAAPTSGAALLEIYEVR